jgi:hypothetical protein
VQKTTSISNAEFGVLMDTRRDFGPTGVKFLPAIFWRTDFLVEVFELVSFVTWSACSEDSDLTGHDGYVC